MPFETVAIFCMIVTRVLRCLLFGHRDSSRQDAGLRREVPMSVENHFLRRTPVASGVHEYVAHYHSERNHEGKSKRLAVPADRENTRGAACAMSRTARRAAALLPSGRRLNWRGRSADDREAAIRRLSCGCHAKLTVGKFASGPWIRRLSMDNREDVQEPEHIFG